MTQKCDTFIVSGMVQGVGFRYHTVHMGLKLGLVGYAKNLANGDVEVVVCGNEVKIEEMAFWLKSGPPTSRVDLVRRVASPICSYQGFKIL